MLGTTDTARVVVGFMVYNNEVNLDFLTALLGKKIGRHKEHLGASIGSWMEFDRIILVRLRTHQSFHVETAWTFWLYDIIQVRRV